MNDSLSTYLADHLAGSVHAVDVVKHLCAEHLDSDVGKFAADLLHEIESDRQVLLGIANRVGDGASVSKDLAAWLAERLSRIKLRPRGNSGLGTFEALEHVSLGVQGKWALWRVLDLLASDDRRLQGVNYQHLGKRALDQLTRLEEWRLRLAQTALRARE